MLSDGARPLSDVEIDAFRQVSIETLSQLSDM